MNHLYQKVYIHPKILDAMKGITSERANLTRWEKIKIFFGFMDEPPRVRVEPKLICDLIPRVKLPQGKFMVKGK
jgi:hypothetical protein